MNWIIPLLIWGLGFTSAEQQPSSTSSSSEDVEMRIPASEFNAKTIFHLKNINGTLEAVG
ncbi:hypothetical protein [Gracilimonas sp.]|uniref:hypothetical protein n=1 Tax=Gracilimonas sp. TaxID=1974203 RepID=UPI00287232C7|nr:hypothetical protein [Gracilimonas sp.]